MAIFYKCNAFYLADLWVIRSSEIGQHEDYIHCRSHLGKHLEVGDECLGYDLKTSNINSDNLDNLGPISHFYAIGSSQLPWPETFFTFSIKISCYQNVESIKDGNYPDAVLVRKVFAKREKRVERRKWMLKRIIQTKTDVSFRYHNPKAALVVRSYHPSSTS